jgi:hypothetical protein
MFRFRGISCCPGIADRGASLQLQLGASLVLSLRTFFGGVLETKCLPESSGSNGSLAIAFSVAIDNDFRQAPNAGMQKSNGGPVAYFEEASLRLSSVGAFLTATTKPLLLNRLG